VRLESGIVFALAIISGIMSLSYFKKSLASLSFSLEFVEVVCLTMYVLLRPNFSAILEVLNKPA
jgi:hypothetical protein